MDGVAHSQHAANIFQNQMLETGARAEQWDLPLAGKLDDGQNAFETFVRAAGNNPNAVETTQFLNAGWRSNFGRFEPALLDIDSQRGAGVLDGFLRRLRTVARSRISDQRQ